ncbi:hypothetical protein N8H74_26340 [Pseudomonas sp. B2M1-30]|uniref:hypothetical protein n=1 Tax=Pseudomonas TaxID=286 RepID=UPI0021C9A23F|nr:MULTISPECIES: hypothetical protein [Pseudomonas]MCU0121796.1 hypothetical protein [Pseudomonas sp. B2M1-30]MCU7263816.1 hypothetical protein [Pseudomonas koreensis]
MLPKIARIGMSIALIACAPVMNAQAASDHEIAVVVVASHQVCGEKHPEEELSLEQFISLHPRMSAQMADHVREIATQPAYKEDVENAILRLHTEADQILLKVICDGYYQEG